MVVFGIQFTSNTQDLLTGMELLQDIESIRRNKIAGHILRLQRERPARRRKKKEGGRRRHAEIHSEKTWRRWVSTGMDPAGSPVTATDGDFSSPDAPRGTGGPKSK